MEQPFDSVGQGFEQGAARTTYLCSTVSGASAGKTERQGAIQGRGAGVIRRAQPFTSLAGVLAADWDLGATVSQSTHTWLLHALELPLAW